MSDLILALDIGGTKIAAALVVSGGVLVHREQLPTPHADSEQVWANAYAELKGEQKKWQKEIEARFDTGIQKWAAEESALTSTIRAAREEFTAAAKQERSKTEQVIDLDPSTVTEVRPAGGQEAV